MKPFTQFSFNWIITGQFSSLPLPSVYQTLLPFALRHASLHWLLLLLWVQFVLFLPDFVRNSWVKIYLLWVFSNIFLCFIHVGIVDVVQIFSAYRFLFHQIRKLFGFVFFVQWHQTTAQHPRWFLEHWFMILQCLELCKLLCLRDLLKFVRLHHESIVRLVDITRVLDWFVDYFLIKNAPTICLLIDSIDCSRRSILVPRAIKAIPGRLIDLICCRSLMRHNAPAFILFI